MKSSVSIVIPVHNERLNLPQLIERCVKVGRTLDRPWELILIDDGSRDGSSEMLVEAAKTYPGEIKSLILNRNYGQHNAILCGFANAQGDVMVTLDADLQNQRLDFAWICLGGLGQHFARAIAATVVN